MNSAIHSNIHQIFFLLLFISKFHIISEMFQKKHDLWDLPGSARTRMVHWFLLNSLIHNIILIIYSKSKELVPADHTNTDGFNIVPIQIHTFYPTNSWDISEKKKNGWVFNPQKLDLQPPKSVNIFWGLQKIQQPVWCMSQPPETSPAIFWGWEIPQPQAPQGVSAPIIILGWTRWSPTPNYQHQQIRKTQNIKKNSKPLPAQNMASGNAIKKRKIIVLACLEKKWFHRDESIENIDHEDGKQSGEDSGNKCNPEEMVDSIQKGNNNILKCDRYDLLIFSSPLGGSSDQDKRNKNPHNNPKFTNLIDFPFSCALWYALLVATFPNFYFIGFYGFIYMYHRFHKNFSCLLLIISMYIKIYAFIQPLISFISILNMLYQWKPAQHDIIHFQHLVVPTSNNPSLACLTNKNYSQLSIKDRSINPSHIICRGTSGLFPWHLHASAITSLS
ncbi:putative signal peptide protein [Puccinia sorghi]|uniref:Putative signal peptide protein n=1 Tax=Puccinia sorghi TaxID=27349 RepID=A0A0L6UP41_9BASI|nr:putative signal peptide protein [Puccinia sorghi]